MNPSIGDKFGKWEVISGPIPVGKNSRVNHICRCECGKEKEVDRGNLVFGRTKSCGCAASENSYWKLVTSGKGPDGKPSYAYNSWVGLNKRCYNPKNASYKNYGGRGITVCDRWRFGEDGKHAFVCFLLDMGERDSRYSIDRINPDGNYEPSNCQWVDKNHQSRTTRKYLSIGPCKICGERRGNYGEGRCGRCSSYFRDHKSERPKFFPPGFLKKPKKICVHCNQSETIAKNRCGPCYRYLKKYGVDRPESLISPKPLEEKACLNCGILTMKMTKGRCKPCNTYLYSLKIERPKRLWSNPRIKEALS